MESGMMKLLYIVVLEGREGGGGRGGGEGLGFRYTRSVLQTTLQLMGCKARHAFKISRRVFEIMRYEHSIESNIVPKDDSKGKEIKLEGSNGSENFELYKKQTTIEISRDEFVNVVCDALSSYKYVGPNQRADFLLACKIRERKESVTILLCGTSGCGKSTLSALLGSRLGITNVISTDSIRHMMRGFSSSSHSPLLYASTYHAGDCLDPVAVSQAKSKKKNKKHQEQGNVGESGERKGEGNEMVSVSKRQLAIEGYKAQSEMVIESLDRLITSWEERKESVVVEGVHLSLNFVMGLMKKHPSIIPFMLYITNEEKHTERFAVRAKYMTLDPAKNKYVKYIRNIRSIQDYLCNRADKHLVPKINNTNVDRSVAVIHATVFGCLRRRESGENLYDPITNTVPILSEEYRNQCISNSLSSKGVLQLIQRKGSDRNLMALLNTDGSVCKAWPVNTGKIGVEPVNFEIWKAESVNLQFGSFGLSAWKNDEAGTSSSSLDEGKENVDNSLYFSSSCSSPKLSESNSKELMDGDSVSGSEDEEEVFDNKDAESDEDLSDVDEKDLDEMEEAGSVDEDSTKSDEEYDDLAMKDGNEEAYSSDEDSKLLTMTNTHNVSVSDKCKYVNNTAENLIEKYKQGFDLALS